jgi:tripartite-type tricarboxylate transporter receptor subunit TctC
MPRTPSPAPSAWPPRLRCRARWPATRAAQPARASVTVLHPQGRIDVAVEIDGQGDDARITRAALVRTARKILQGDLHIPDYVFSKPDASQGDNPVKKLLAPILAAAAVSAAPAALAFPTKTVTIVVPTAAGGGNDAMARTIAQKLGPLLGQTIIIDNRAGANGSIASEYVARATPDGHTLMFGYIATHSMNPALQKLRYDPVADFEPVGLVGYSPTLMVANAAVAGEGREGPGRAAQGQARQVHLRVGRQRHRAALRGRAVQAQRRRGDAGRALQGFGPAVSDTIGGQTQFMFPSLFTAMPHVKSGKLKAMAVAGPKRSALLPDVPTLKEPASTASTCSSGTACSRRPRRPRRWSTSSTRR